MAFNFLFPLEVKPKVPVLGTTTSEWTSKWNFMKNVHNLYEEQANEMEFDGESMSSIADKIVGENDTIDIFFEKIKENRNFVTHQPNKINPYVEFSGRTKDGQTGEEKIKRWVSSINETESERFYFDQFVKLKMEVSYTKHAHIIGKRGLSVNRVMEETNCHVHFPDSIRLNLTEKSNQVSISGLIEDVERARSRLRNLSALIFFFEIPAVFLYKKFSNTSPYVVKIQQEYNVQVMFCSRSKLHATFVLVKGAEWEVQEVKRATLLLKEYMCEDLVNHVSIQMSMEILPKYHALVTGDNYSNIKTIMQNTNAEITFPNSEDVNINNLKKSNVIISGNIHDVYAARQQLMGLLPLSLMFNLPENTNGLPVKSKQISKIQSSLDVTVTICYKAKYQALSCIVKGVERYASNIYKARNEILGIKEPSVIAEIPTSYFSPQNDNYWQINNVDSSQFTYDNMPIPVRDFIEQFSKPPVEYEQDSLISISQLLKEDYNWEIASSLPSTSSSPTDLIFNSHSPTNVIDNITDSVRGELTSILTSIGLEKYARTFTFHEIDLTTFLTLTEQDLIELGVAAFGARRKMMLLITELNDCSIFSPVEFETEKENPLFLASDQSSSRYFW